MTPTYRILTFNWHEAYVSMLAATGQDFDVVQRDKGGSPFWLYTTRPVPDNVRLIHLQDARKRLRSGYYDLVVCHTTADAREAARGPAPRAMVFHNYRQTELALADAGGRGHPFEDPAGLDKRLGGALPVFISPGKKESFAPLEGPVIPPGIDLEVFRGYVGDELRVLRVGNFLIERDVMLGGRISEEALRGIPHSTFGLNPTVTGAGLSASFDALKLAYRGHRVYLHTTREPYEDSYNLALLEAMATGMPIVALEHSASIIEHGVNGLLGSDAASLRRHVLTLLHDEALARRLGEKSRALVARRFPMDRFLARWMTLFRKLAASRRPATPPRGRPGSAGAPRRRILMFRGDDPASPQAALEEVLRRDHFVITAGPSGEGHDRRSPDLQVPNGASLREVLDRLPFGFEPELIIWSGSEADPFPRNLFEAPLPLLGYYTGEDVERLSTGARFDSLVCSADPRDDAARLLDAAGSTTAAVHLSRRRARFAAFESTPSTSTTTRSERRTPAS